MGTSAQEHATTLVESLGVRCMRHEQDTRQHSKRRQGGRDSNTHDKDSLGFWQRRELVRGLRRAFAANVPAPGHRMRVR
jgi:serine/threonine-protein kinase RIO1